jgi:hypothetical protein
MHAITGFVPVLGSSRPSATDPRTVAVIPSLVFGRRHHETPWVRKSRHLFLPLDGSPDHYRYVSHLVLASVSKPESFSLAYRAADKDTAKHLNTTGLWLGFSAFVSKRRTWCLGRAAHIAAVDLCGVSHVRQSCLRFQMRGHLHLVSRVLCLSICVKFPPTLFVATG